MSRSRLKAALAAGDLGMAIQQARRSRRRIHDPAVAQASGGGKATRIASRAFTYPQRSGCKQADTENLTRLAVTTTIGLLFPQNRRKIRASARRNKQGRLAEAEFTSARCARKLPWSGAVNRRQFGLDVAVHGVARSGMTMVR